ncbi:PEP-CTERM putative exosortase interaction domain-containing protein [Rivularia sp. PCC 7116]|uniref:PEP-CTERM sorting domain-containing protein n=1 Tax=Rivularia sp. PCC 7116 TaxID=373994 RepID=UPI00029F2A46|nr:PEP-CTERM sorting domain-containing protein [Rivularia sp. PCC 7116]AFY57732.1 PEP-CTERM putative exosortase interaction domain-containing protein [Rivularia sp. PCC 7116]
MKIFNKLAILAASLAMSSGLMQTEVHAASFSRIVNLDARENTTNNAISLNLLAGTYKVNYIGMSDGGNYDAWNAWGEGVTSFCNSHGEGCRKGWINSYRISFEGFSDMFSSPSVYRNPLQAMQNAVDTSFTLASNTKVNFFIADNYYQDNVGGVSLRLSSQSIPEPTSVISLFAVGAISLFIYKRQEQIV